MIHPSLDVTSGRMYIFSTHSSNAMHWKELRVRTSCGIENSEWRTRTFIADLLVLYKMASLLSVFCAAKLVACGGRANKVAERPVYGEVLGRCSVGRLFRLRQG